jgi:hydrogen peroxide-dependent heme synthase
MHDPQVPETLEGFCLLHQMFRVRWADWRGLEAATRQAVLAEAVAALAAMVRGDEGTTVAGQLLGHKGDLMLLHMRRDFPGLAAAQLEVARLRLSAYLEPTTSFLSVVELGLYEMTAVIHKRLREGGLAPDSAEFDAAFAAELEDQRRRVGGRLYPAMPAGRYWCFYPMNKRRGEQVNWYRLPVEERARLMRDHGRVGRAYGDRVTQIISGAIGLDDWEWGVDLLSEDPVVFKKLIYEMRFDEASAAYAEFGPFYVALRCDAVELPRLLEGQVPAAPASLDAVR